MDHRANAAGLALLLACSSSTEPAGGVDIALSLSNDVLVAGDSVEFRVTVTARTADPVEFTTQQCLSYVHFVDGERQRVLTHPTGCNDIAITRRVGPGEVLKEARWFTGWPRPSSGPFIEPGHYLLVGVISSNPELGASDTLTLQVVP